MPIGASALLLDTDTVFLRPFRTYRAIQGHMLAARPAPSSPWKQRYSEKWVDVFEALNLDPQGADAPIYLNAGVVFFDNERVFDAAAGERFPDAWLRAALKLDQVLPLPQTRPWLDQVALCALATSMPQDDLRILRRNWNATKLTRETGEATVPFILHYHGDHSSNRVKRFLGEERLQSILDFGAGATSQATLDRMVARASVNHSRISLQYREDISALRERSFMERVVRLIKRR